MKSRLLAAAAALVGSLTMLSCADTYSSVQMRYPAGPVSADVSVFYDGLAPYGSWVTVATYGEVWVPRVSPWWRPYSEGHWVMTDDGWAWIADEPWGWGPFHYGRWYFDARWGWVWVPGRVWSPAWVAWRSGGGHVGWAPLPPQVSWEGETEFVAGRFDFDAWIAPQHWCFVEERYMTAPVVREYLVPPARNVTYVLVTANVTNYTVVENRIVNRGVDVAHVERVTEHAVPRYQIVDRPTAGATTASQGQVAIYRPVGRGAAGNQPPAAGARPAPVQPSQPTPTGHAEPRQQAGEGRAASTRPPMPVQQPNAGAPATATPFSQDVAKRHEAERQELQRHQEEERARVRQLQEQERRQASEQAKAEETRRRHQAEQQALARQHQTEQQALARRQKEERSAAQAKTRPGGQSKQKDDSKQKKDSGSKQ